MKTKKFLVFLGMISLLSARLYAQDEDPALAQTVEHLIQYVEKSGLIYIRNGTEHDSISAAQHIQEKYDYFKTSILTPEDFIQKAASKSVVTGQPYLVKFPDGTQKRLDDWLLSELKNYRAVMEKKNEKELL